MRILNTKRQFKNSGQLTLYSPEITTGSSHTFVLDSRFVPYDEAMLVNLNSNNDCIVTVNGHHKSTLPKGSQVDLNGYNVTQITVLNSGASTINANEIILHYRHTGREGKNKLAKLQTGVSVASGLRLLGGL